MFTNFDASWDDTRQTRYCLTFLRGWTWDDWMQGHIAAYREIAATQHPVDLIVVLTHPLPIGDSISCLRFARQMPTNIRQVVYANRTGPTLQHTVQAVGQVMRWKVPHFTNSLPEARAYLEQNNPLPHDKAVR